MAVTTKLISKQIGRGKQDLVYVEVLTLGELKLQISIASDSYGFQSYANISVLDKENSMKWNLLHFIHHSQMETPEKLYYNSESNQKVMESWFKADRDELLRVAKALIN